MPSQPNPLQLSPLKRKRSISPRPRYSPISTTNSTLPLALPALLALPPTHPYHLQSLRLSLISLRRFLKLTDHDGPGLDPDVECRAWTAFVELGMNIIGAGLSSSGGEGEEWAQGLEYEMGGAIARGLVLSQKFPSLHGYTHHLTLLHSRLAHWQHNYKQARSIVKRHIASLSSADSPVHHYSAHLTLVSHALASNPVDLSAALHSLTTMHTLADRWGHNEVLLLSQVIKLRALVSALNWSEVFPLLDALESALGLAFPEPQIQAKAKSKPQPLSLNSQNTPSSSTTPLGPDAEPDQNVKPETKPHPDVPKSALQMSLELHVLTLGVLAHVQAGRSADASKRITRLHTVLDSGVLEREGIREGIVEVPLSGLNQTQHAPLLIHTTHPRVFFHLAFLVSAVAMRDATGRRPKPKVFATEGLAVCERERAKESRRAMGRYLSWTGLRERQDVEERLTKIEADLLCELVGVSIQRSEFDEAEEHLARLIAHTRTHTLWDAYSARITLYHAHLAHALCRRERALECYRAAAHLANKEERGDCNKDAAGSKIYAGKAIARFVRVAAQAGEVGLRIGMARSHIGGERMDHSLKRWGSEVAKECRQLGGTLEAVGRVLEACLAEEIVVAKNHLKAALNLTTHALDNHLRALVLALASSHYLHTSSEYAEVMLTTAKQLAAGLGAPASKAHDPQFNRGRTAGEHNLPQKVGNAPLGLWVGQRFLGKCCVLAAVADADVKPVELYRRTGRDARAKQQGAINVELANALRGVDRAPDHADGDVDGDGDIRMQ